MPPADLLDGVEPVAVEPVAVELVAARVGVTWVDAVRPGELLEDSPIVDLPLDDTLPSCRSSVVTVLPTSDIEVLSVRMSARHAARPFGSVDACGDAVTVAVTVSVTVGTLVLELVVELLGLPELLLGDDESVPVPVGSGVCVEEALGVEVGDSVELGAALDRGRPVRVELGDAGPVGGELPSVTNGAQLACSAAVDVRSAFSWLSSLPAVERSAVS